MQRLRQAQEAARPTGTSSLTIVYQASSSLAVATRDWLLGQETFLPLEFVTGESALGRQLLPPSDSGPVQRQSPATLIVIGSQGQIWRGHSAWLMCLWACQNRRKHALKLAREGRSDLARDWFVQCTHGARRAQLRVKYGENRSLEQKASEGTLYFRLGVSIVSSACAALTYSIGYAVLGVGSAPGGGFFSLLMACIMALTGWIFFLGPMIVFLREDHQALSLPQLPLIGGFLAAAMIAVPYLIRNGLENIEAYEMKMLLAIAHIGILMGLAYPLLLRFRKSCQPCPV